MKALLLIPILTSTCAVSASASYPDPKIVSEIVRSTRISQAEILKSLSKCDGTTLDMKVCGNYRWKIEDLRLNNLYGQARSLARDVGAEGDLVKAQRAWIAFRDAACAFEGKIGAGGGSAEGLYVLDCLKQLTKVRADDLQAMIKTYAP